MTILCKYKNEIFIFDIDIIFKCGKNFFAVTDDDYNF